MDLRASDAERERVADFLSESCLEGRLEHDELDERTAGALRARTRGELAALVADLPGSEAALPSAGAAVAVARASSARRVIPGVMCILALLLVLALVVEPAVVLYLGLFAGFVVVAGVALLVLGFLVTLSAAPWAAAGAGIVWAVRRLRRG